MATRELQLVDESSHPHLSGRFAPVRREVDASDLVVEGNLPTDLTGVYRRNGPNPKHTPLGSYTFPLEGDGMIHAVWIEGGRARYRNRWVRTRGMAAEDAAGRSLYGGLLTPAFVDPALLGTDPDPGWPFRLDPFINVVRHGGRYLALEEATPPYEITEDLETVGRWDDDGRLRGMCAHPRVDPRTGEMVLFNYDFEEPYLTWSVYGPDGSLRRPPTAVEGIDRTFMVHDFTITERFVVMVVGPAVFDGDAMMSGGQVLQWRPDLGTQVLLVPRDGGPQQRIVTDPFWVWHFANAFERAGRVVVDFPWYNVLTGGLSGPDAPPLAGSFTRAEIDPTTGTVALTHLDDALEEFPRIDDRLTGLPHRYVLATVASPDPGLVAGERDTLVRWDMETAERVHHECHAVIGETVFAPRDGAEDELDGYYLTFGSDHSASRSWLYVWDAAEFPRAPRARVQIPQRVPNGLHGNWFPAEPPSEGAAPTR